MRTMIESNQNELVIQTGKIKEGAMMYRAINHPLRQTIMRHLHENGKMTVTQIHTLLDIEQSVTSQHLAILRSKDLLKTERAGKFVHYSINYGRLEFLQDLTKNFLHRDDIMDYFNSPSLQ